MTKTTRKSTSKTKPSVRFWDLKDSTFTLGFVHIYNCKTKEYRHIDNFSFDSAFSPEETIRNVLKELNMSQKFVEIVQSEYRPGWFGIKGCKDTKSKSDALYNVEMLLRAEPSSKLKYNYQYWKQHK